MELTQRMFVGLSMDKNENGSHDGRGHENYNEKTGEAAK